MNTTIITVTTNDTPTYTWGEYDFFWQAEVDAINIRNDYRHQGYVIIDNGDGFIAARDYQTVNVNIIEEEN